MVIGISDYSNLKPLDFCKNDGREMAKVLFSLGYEVPDTNVLLGHVGWEKMRDAIYDLFRSDTIEPSDTVLFYYSGHGVPDNDQDVFLATSDIDVIAKSHYFKILRETKKEKGKIFHSN